MTDTSGISGAGVIGIILAGGSATRMGGGDKGLAHVGGRPILERVIATMGVQCDVLVLNANGDAARFARYGLAVAADPPGSVIRHGDDRQGPLAGVLAGLDWAATHHPDALYAVTVPTDTPFLPDDLVQRLAAARQAADAPLACARSGDRTHGIVALWSIALRHDLRRALQMGVRKVALFTQRHRGVQVEWPIDPHDPFLNANTPAELAVADRLAGAVERAGLAAPVDASSPRRGTD